jgi:hypothetical protein
MHMEEEMQLDARTAGSAVTLAQTVQDMLDE